MKEETVFKIEKGIPIPPKKHKRATYAFFEDMEVGDSVYFPEYSHSEMSKNSNYARYYGKRFTPIREFRSRQVGKGFRIWRVK